MSSNDGSGKDSLSRATSVTSVRRRRSPIQPLSLIAWTSGTGIVALYLTRFITGTGAQVIGGVFIWGLLFSVPLLLAELRAQAQEVDGL
ncbi:hypothetical protein SAMN06269185_1055 [Natronoarchaeum philippinense]|uniref:Uncharacterized protein n=1 Tax=Natronoarchaeum philippinense TaxID=558529 RepID=A0A285NB14_NATPI|nr:hypothetical protein [Natronoarchaeum philippinense]SNZ06117.1 hypothetical protein SAMN06269185_1055 [Natronoarchaeum philippinense]